MEFLIEHENTLETLTDAPNLKDLVMLLINSNMVCLDTSAVPLLVYMESHSFLPPPTKAMLHRETPDTSVVLPSDSG